MNTAEVGEMMHGGGMVRELAWLQHRLYIGKQQDVSPKREGEARLKSLDFTE